MPTTSYAQDSFLREIVEKENYRSLQLKNQKLIFQVKWNACIYSSSSLN